MFIGNFTLIHKEGFYFLVRILFGILFLQHGLQKLFGVFGANQVPLFGLLGFAGVVELLAGIALTLGIFTRLSAALSAVFIFGAYLYAHAGQALIPAMNGGEAALLYFGGFLVLSVTGAGAFSLEKAVLKKEIF